jgi:transcriptional regulator GlxA family with amidase domain
VLIEQGRHTVDAIAEETGFGNRERMRRAFLRTIGQPPQTIRRNSDVDTIHIQPELRIARCKLTREQPMGGSPTAIQRASCGKQERTGAGPGNTPSGLHALPNEGHHIGHRLVETRRCHRRAGGQSQFSTLLELEPKSDRIQRALDYAGRNLKKLLSVDKLAMAAALSPRQFSRAFRAETGQSPARAVEHLRVAWGRTKFQSKEVRGVALADQRHKCHFSGHSRATHTIGFCIEFW